MSSAIDKALEVILGPLDPAPVYRYYVDIEGSVAGSFIECTGIATRREVLEIREGGVNTHTHKLPGRLTYGTITLKKGVMFADDMWKWFQKGSTNLEVERTSISIIHYASVLHLPARWYNIRDVFPVGWNVSDFDAGSSMAAVESLELAFSTIEVEPLSMQTIMAKLM